MFGIASRYVKAKGKALALPIIFLICKARTLFLARRSLETTPNLGLLIPLLFRFRSLMNYLFKFLITKSYKPIVTSIITQIKYTNAKTTAELVAIWIKLALLSK